MQTVKPLILYSVECESRIVMQMCHVFGGCMSIWGEKVRCQYCLCI